MPEYLNAGKVGGAWNIVLKPFIFIITPFGLPVAAVPAFNYIEQDAEVIQNMFGVYLIVPVFGATPEHLLSALLPSLS